MKIAYVVGSLATSSLNRRLALMLTDLAPEGVEFVEVEIAALPLYNREREAEFASVVGVVKETLRSADGVLFVTPEYNRSFSAALHNALEWVSRPRDEQPFSGKPVATIGTSPSGISTATAQQPLRSMLNFFNAKLMGQPEGYINAVETGLMSGDLTDSAREFLTSWIAAFVEFVAHNK